MNIGYLDKMAQRKMAQRKILRDFIFTHIILPV